MAEEIVEQGYRELADEILEHNPGVDLARVRAAFELADRAHAGQKRKAGTPYVTHCVAAATICAQMGLDEDSVVAALLHDCIEDTSLTHEDIARQFGTVVADIVEGVTKLTRVHFTNREDEQMENLRKMLMAMAKDIRVILIKIADRLHNMRTMEYQTPEKQKQKSYETMEIYAPIAHRLGMQKMKWELEDLSLKYLDPVGFQEITDALEAKAAEYEGFMDLTRRQIEERLAQSRIDGIVYGRLKHPYSIYRKMYAQNKGMEDVFDLIAFRVIVDTVADCYNVLGIVHDLYHPILGRFKDYIGTPKPNMYQSLHTTVIGHGGIPFEVQIRTREMHEVAEYGVAAHWKYKQDGQGAGDEKNYEWVRRLLENQEGADAEEFIHSLKVDLFADEVFVFTPAGDVINLPAGATPIDFAYTIHSQVGNHMVAAKVNGRIVQFDHKLNNGDVVEVETSPSAHGPSRDWLKIAKSSNARSKIRQWFKKERRDENIVNGKASFEYELKRVGITLRELTSEENLPAVLDKAGYNALDDMYAAIGYGGVTALKLVGRLREEINRILKARQSSPAAEPETPEPEKPGPAHYVPGTHGVVVEGIDNCLVKLAKCCFPVPGDQIVGFITRGSGVSVHRADCPNAAPERRPPEEEGRWIKVSWADKTDSQYQTTLEVISRDRPELMVDISTVISSTKTQFRGLSAQIIPDGSVLVTMDVIVSDAEQLKTVMRRLEQLSGVQRVSRPAK